MCRSGVKHAGVKGRHTPLAHAARLACSRAPVPYRPKALSVQVARLYFAPASS